MNQTPLRVPLIVLSAFLALTAIAGGIGLLRGLNVPPVEMLKGSLFTSFVIPGLALAIIVGGLGLCAAILLAMRLGLGELACVAAGMAIIVFEIVEILAIGSPPGMSRILQVFYLSFGLVLVALSVVSLVVKRRLDGAVGRR
jgi:hypothetical protein